MKTTLHTALCIAIRIGAVLLALDVLERVASLLTLGEADPHRFFGAMLFCALYLGVAVVLWLWPGMLAWWASSRASNEIFVSDLAGHDWQRIALAVVGVWLAVAGLSTCLGHGLLMVFLGERVRDYSTGLLPTTEWYWLFRGAVQTLAGAAIVVGSSGLVSLLARIRRYPEATATEEPDGQGRS
ncbi:MAG: hypothetical protein ACTHMK_17725 [Dyella sp.]|uniref:hypothetical protein n=1 Tax=Dyella sp. TaxID=1869338 RepID=UPI003F7DA1D6